MKNILIWEYFKASDRKFNFNLIFL